MSGDDDDREEEQLHERIEMSPLDEPTYRVTFERDEGQAYRVGARVADPAHFAVVADDLG